MGAIPASSGELTKCARCRDAINRQTSLESLLNNGLEHKELQFLFLTPLVSLASAFLGHRLGQCILRSSSQSKFAKCQLYTFASLAEFYNICKTSLKPCMAQDISAVEGAKKKIREKGGEIPDKFVRIVKLQPARK